MQKEGGKEGERRREIQGGTKDNLQWFKTVT